MATYAKILKDNADNQILPYTRSKLVYMDDGSTVEDVVTRPATNTQMGRVLIGNNLEYDGNGTISLSKSGVCNALGYTPAYNQTITEEVSFSDLANANGSLEKQIFNYKVNSKYFDSLNTINGRIIVTRIHKYIYFITLHFTSQNDIISNSNYINEVLKIRLEPIKNDGFEYNRPTNATSMIKIIPLYHSATLTTIGYEIFGLTNPIYGVMHVSLSFGGIITVLDMIPYKTIPAGTTLSASFCLYDYTGDPV